MAARCPTLVLPSPLEQRVAALETDVARLTAALAQLAGLDDGAWLAIVGASVRGHVFSVKELRAHRVVDRELRRALAGMSAKAIGARLRRLAGRNIDGWIVQRVDRVGDGCIWSLIHQDAGIDASGRV
jgi:hypothetical protein